MELQVSLAIVNCEGRLVQFDYMCIGKEDAEKNIFFSRYMSQYKFLVYKER